MRPTSAARPVPTSEGTEVCTFRLGDLHFGIAVGMIQEVLKHQEMSRVPLAPPVVRGLINLRGQIVTAFDLRTRLGLGERPAGQAPSNVVARFADGSILSLLVDEIGDVLRVDPALFEKPPETISSTAREFISGVYKLEGRLLLILDIDKAVNVVAAGMRKR